MAIIIKPEPDVYVTESELAKYREQYQQDYMTYCGTPPTLNEYIARKKKQAA